MSQRDELKTLLLRALTEPLGVTFTVQGQRLGARQLAINALNAAKRELAVDEPSVLDLIFKVVPGSRDEIAIIRIQATQEDL